jgi:DNA-binding MltR family transcriptional regulator
MANETEKRTSTQPDALKVKANASIPDFITEILEKQSLKSTESPRAYIIIIVAYIDDLLSKLLAKKLVILSDDNDSLLNSYGPLYNLGPKIDLAYRMGLISRELSWSLHQLRKMRDACAHSHDKKAFSDSPIKDFIDPMYDKINDKSAKTNSEDKFHEICTNILILLWSGINHTTTNPEHPKEGFFK